jgi:hypothetical protein
MPGMRAPTRCPRWWWPRASAAHLLGFNFADAVAAIIVGGMIVKAGAQFTWDAIRELIDTGLSPEEVAAIRASIAGTPGVLSMHELRTRRMAHQVLVDAHVQVNPRISVSEGHRVAETARRRVLASHPEVLDVLVHVDAENDLMGNAAAELPDRIALLAHLRRPARRRPARLRAHHAALPGQPRRSRDIPPTGLSPMPPCSDACGTAWRRDPWFSAIRLNETAR